jgi:hypothetical protein
MRFLSFQDTLIWNMERNGKKVLKHILTTLRNTKTEVLNTSGGVRTSNERCKPFPYSARMESVLT